MQHQPATVEYCHPARSPPGQPLLAVGRVEDVVERVAAVARTHAGGDGEQVPVVVAEHAARRRAEAAQPAQRRERSGPAIDEVAEHVQVVERRGTALDVADEVMHGSILLRWLSPDRCARAWTSPSCCSWSFSTPCSRC